MVISVDGKLACGACETVLEAGKTHTCTASYPGIAPQNITITVGSPRHLAFVDLIKAIDFNQAEIADDTVADGRLREDAPCVDIRFAGGLISAVPIVAAFADRFSASILTETTKFDYPATICFTYHDKMRL